MLIISSEGAIRSKKVNRGANNRSNIIREIENKEQTDRKKLDILRIRSKRFRNLITRSAPLEGD